ncbi:MAG TPA: thiosulfate oxidation carrier complex protein SoxZ [Candidatus Accumulibacter phosphatis]|nr:MAG: putative secreted protein [Candidatus Accumulibacter sp. SK-11]HAY28084.1 thiosulfate oxidation carrier complex protein SoxZ [Accumulibacter sp.]HRL76572.1 thiosulfate oxidation carrier complex protein SoxZ [Candidatus Accumulibacter phosphatis]HCN67191.1 thiosulfate oxidation carrier complex protein SoxZ [Accumulibacter sp.]HCV14081.1 thiosulfate oxidation carrier complex protein SoxZ [Accumulibacter sp.]
MGEAIKIRASVQGELTEIRFLMPHPMETGQRKGPESGKLIPAHFIQSFSLTANGALLVGGQLNTSISRNPLFSLYARGLKPGDRIAVEWSDTKGDRRRDEVIVAVS